MVPISYGLFAVLLITDLTNSQQCKVGNSLVQEIKGYQPVVKKIIEAIKGPHAGKFYEDLTDYLDTFGQRFSGTTNLEKAIDGIIARQQAANLEVSTQKVMVPKWVRGEESAELITPRREKLTILGLGFSGNTSAEGITAQVVEVKSFDDLAARQKEIRNKIVLFNQPYTNYSSSKWHRLRGPRESSQLGAAAVLVRSVTPFSINSPHTGITYFNSTAKNIPAAAITIEHANFLSRLIAKGANVTVNLKMSAMSHPPVESRNVIADIKGRTKPNEYVTISGHIDSWDVGQGALDDAGGAFLAWRSLALIKSLNLTAPARTIRSIMWTAEEVGMVGAEAYKKERADEIRNWTAAFESDEGVFQAKGISFSGSDSAACIMQVILSLLTEVNGTELNRLNSVGSDIASFGELGVPLGEPYNVPNNYFWYQHTDADWIDVLNSKDLDQNLAIFTSVIYILANLSEPLPKREIIPTTTPQPVTPAASTNSSASAMLFSQPLLLSILLLVFLKMYKKY